MSEFVTTRDGYRLGATRFLSASPPRGRIVVAGATGVPQGFYRRFADHAATRGFEVLTFDYRGLARSKQTPLRGMQASFLDWARLDLAAVVDHMAQDGLPLFLVGHSFGAQALGLLPNHGKVAGLYAFGLGAGWAGWMPRLERAKVWLLWHVVMPPLAALYGYAPGKIVGIGEDLPLGVYRQWKRWCGFPHYFFDDPAMSGQLSGYAEVRCPIVAANALDDLWALPRSRDAFLKGYRGAEIRTLDLATGDSIGHMGYFRQRAQPLWDDALDWFGLR